MKKSELFFSAIQVPIDFLMLVLAAVTAFKIRDYPQIIAQLPKLYQFPFDTYLQIVLMVVPLFLIIYAIEGLYVIRATRKFLRETLKVFTATSVGFLIIIVAIFLKQEWFSSRFVILSAWLIGTVYVVFARLLLEQIQKYLLVKRHIGAHNLVLIGRNGKIKEIEQIMLHDPRMGYQIVGHLENASVHDLKQLREEVDIDEVILCDQTATDAEQEKLVDYCTIHNITFQYIPTTFQASRFEIKMLNGEPIIQVRPTPLDGWGKILKRTFDIVGATVLIILFSPVMLVTTLAIWLETGMPIIYRNERVGGDGKKFRVLKFRYMKQAYCTDPNTPEGRKAIELEKELIANQSVRKGPLYKIKDDPRKTRVGSFIERYSIDEFPQFFNVLKGDMSLVGPRPHQEREVEKYKEYHRRLLTIRPGITGMAQVSGRSDLDFEDEYVLDVFYIESWSLWLDIQICLKTAKVLMKGRRNNS